MKYTILCFVVALIFATTVKADQNDPQLDVLFEQLHTIKDEKPGLDITAKIWSIWHETDDDVTENLLQNGIALMSTGLNDAALEMFDRVIEHAPTFAEGWNKRATVLYLMDRNEDSLYDIRRTLELEPRHFGALSGLGMIYLEAGQYQAALVAFKNAEKVNPFPPGIRENIKRLETLIKEKTI
ncbi:MAG: hypothetical protein DHS20C01_06280 [marine bacterium B5-7]|nr:MAG: hypothetical protein DHS20C01_06280 [marine bacterium B5-7]